MSEKIDTADFIFFQLQVCGKSQKQVAEEVGFPKANILTMIKQGKTKVPLTRVCKLADALKVSRVYLIKIVLGEYHPDILEAIENDHD